MFFGRKGFFLALCFLGAAIFFFQKHAVKTSYPLQSDSRVNLPQMAVLSAENPKPVVVKKNLLSGIKKKSFPSSLKTPPASFPDFTSHPIAQTFLQAIVLEEKKLSSDLTQKLILKGNEKFVLVTQEDQGKELLRQIYSASRVFIELQSAARASFLNKMQNYIFSLEQTYPENGFILVCVELSSLDEIQSFKEFLKSSSEVKGFHFESVLSGGL
jgi:hypothetical protein